MFCTCMLPPLLHRCLVFRHHATSLGDPISSCSVTTAQAGGRRRREEGGRTHTGRERRGRGGIWWWEVITELSGDQDWSS